MPDALDEAIGNALKPRKREPLDDAIDTALAPPKRDSVDAALDTALADPFASDKNPERDTPTTPERPGAYESLFSPAIEAAQKARHEEIVNAALKERASHGIARRLTIDAAGDLTKAAGSAALGGALAFNEGIDKLRQTGETAAKNALTEGRGNLFQPREDVQPWDYLTKTRETVQRSREANAERSPNYKTITEHTDRAAEMVGSMGSSMIGGPSRFAIMEGLKHPESPVRAWAEAEMFLKFQGALGKAMGGVDPSKAREAWSTFGSTVMAGVASGQSVEEAIGAGVVFTLHGAAKKAPPRLGVNNPGATMAERGSPEIVRPDPTVTPDVSRPVEAARPVESAPIEDPAFAPEPSARPEAPEWKAAVEVAQSHGLSRETAESVADEAILPPDPAREAAKAAAGPLPTGAPDREATPDEAARQKANEQGYSADEARRWAEATPEQVADARAYDAERDAMRNETVGDDSFDVPAEPPASPPKPAPTREPFRTTSIQNDVVNEERAARMLGPLAKPARLKNPEAMDNALAAVEKDPDAPYRIAARLNDSAGEPTVLESAILTVGRVKARRDLEAAHDAGIKARKELLAGDPTAADRIADAKIAEAAAEANMAAADLADQRHGTETARDLQFRQVLAGKDYTVEGIRRKVRAANDYNPLSHDELVKTKEIADKIEQLTKERDAAVARADAADAELVFGPKREMPSRKSPEYGAKNKFVTREVYEATKAELQKLLGSTTLGVNKFLDPAILARVAKTGAFHIEAGARKFADWSEAMVEAFGEKVTPYLKDAWKAAREATKDVTVKTVAADLKKGVSEGKKIGAMSGKMNDLIDLIIESGVHGREPVTETLHEILKEINPDITLSETRREMTRYGEFKLLNMDAVKVERRDIKAQNLQLLKLESMARGESPEATGGQRQSPSDAVRELTKQVNEAKKRGGFKSVDPAKELKSSLDSAKTRARNEIKDIDRQIEAKVKDIAKKSDLVPDAELADLRAKLVEKRKEFYETFGKPGMSDQQRLDMALKAVDKSIAELERRKDTGDVFPKPKGPEKPVDPKLAERRAYRDELRQTIEDMRKAMTPGLTQAEKDSIFLRRHNERKLAELQRQIDTGTVPDKRVRRERVRDEVVLELDTEIRKAQKEVQSMVDQKRLDNETRSQQAIRIATKEIPALLRVWGITFDLGSILVQGGPSTLMHPIEMARTVRKGLKSFRSEDARTADDARIMSDPHYAAALNRKVPFTGLEPNRVVDEAIRSRWMHETFGLRNFERFTHTMLNNMRLNRAKTLDAKTQSNWILKSMQAIGIARSRTGAPTPAEARAIGEAVSILTGRGTTRSHLVNSLLDSSTLLLLAPRYTLGVFQGALGVPLLRGSIRTRTAMATEYARGAASVGALIGLGMAFGWTPDKYGILHKGKTSVDPTMGYAKVWKLAGAAYDAVKPGGSEDSERDKRFAERYARQRLSPLPGALWSRFSGRTIGGKEATYWQMVGDIFTPSVLRDALQADEEDGAAMGLLALGLSAIGARVSTIPDKPEKPKKRKW